MASRGNICGDVSKSSAQTNLAKQQARAAVKKARPSTSASAAAPKPVETVSWYIHNRFDVGAFHLKELTTENRPAKPFDVSVARWMLMTDARKVPSSLTAKAQATEVMRMVTTTVPNKPDNVNYSFVKVANTEVPLAVRVAAQTAARQTALQAVQAARRQAADKVRRGSQSSSVPNTPRNASPQRSR